MRGSWAIFQPITLALLATTLTVSWSLAGPLRHTHCCHHPQTETESCCPASESSRHGHDESSDPDRSLPPGPCMHVCCAIPAAAPSVAPAGLAFDIRPVGQVVAELDSLLNLLDADAIFHPPRA